VYEAIARDIVHGAVVDGVNGTILAYGQTGAGKSFTMIGDTRNYQHRGIAPRAIAQVYEELENRIEIAYAVRVSYMEIYNDRIYDLLESFQPSTNSSTAADLVVVEDARGTSVRGLTQVEAPTEQDALDQLFNGELQRTVAEHQLNKRSNRSHCIFTLHISRWWEREGHPQQAAPRGPRRQRAAEENHGRCRVFRAGQRVAVDDQEGVHVYQPEPELLGAVHCRAQC
jgi:kinesin family protein 6/9